MYSLDCLLLVATPCKAKALRLLVNIYQPKATDTTTAHHLAPVVPGLSIFLSHPFSFTSQALCLARILANNAGIKLRINIKHWAFDFGTGYQITDLRLPSALGFQVTISVA